MLNHYADKLGATPIGILHPYHFGIFSEQMKNITEVYTYDWTDEQL